MSSSSFVIADSVVAEGFHALGQGRQFWRDYSETADPEGIAWAYKYTASAAIGFTWLGPGWHFDPYAIQQREEQASAKLQLMRAADPVQHQLELAVVLRDLRLGPRLQRLAWAIQRGILSSRTSVLKVPDIDLGTAVLGADRDTWPRHWRKDLLAHLEALTWLHIAPGTTEPEFGTQTALLTHVADLRGNAADSCDPDCRLHGGQQHHHFLVNVGRGFLGILESCAAADDGSGVRTYSFPIAGKKSAASLRQLGKSGRLVPIYVPALLGSPAACERLSLAQHRLLQAIGRETTRKTKADRKDLSEAEIITDNSVPLMSNRRLVSCPFLDAAVQHVGFNGNGVRKRLGYRLNTPGGWLAKAGYELGDLEPFLVDLEHLSQVLGLVVVGIMPSDRTWYSLCQIRSLASNPSGRNRLERLHVRIYTTADYVDRWDRIFSWPTTTATPIGVMDDDLQQELLRRSQQRGFQTALATGLGVDKSFLSKVLSGKKPWPPGWLDRARTWLASQQESHAEPAASCHPPLPTPTGPGCFADAAHDYLRRGFSIVPQLAGAKHPCVRWKPFQERRPTEHDVASWATAWPHAGLALVLGPVSGVFVVDVDGPEAHQALLDHLGAEPLAPKVLSGSRKPLRYHLFFQCPTINTKAKATPWHPKLEFRGHRGIVIVPPSLHRSGHAYVWAEGRSLDDLPLPEVPAAILAALTSRPTRRVAPADVPPNPVDGVNASPATREFLAGRHAESPGWNGRLFQAACDLAGRQVPLEQAEPLLLAGARPWDQTEQEQALQTIRSAFAQPREPSRT